MLVYDLILLDLHDERGTPQATDVLTRSFGLAGALWAELQLQDVVAAVGADQWSVRAGASPDGVLGLAADVLRARRPLKEERCLWRLSNHSRSLRNAALAELVGLGAVREEADKLWFLTWRTRHPTDDPSLEADRIAHLRAWLPNADPNQPPGRDELLLGLLRGTKLLGTVWTETELEALRSKIVACTARVPLGRLVHLLIKQQHAANAAVVAAIS